MQKMTETVNTKKFTELFSDLERCNKEEQKQKILEMNEAMEEMDEKEFKSVFTTELFDKICRMIEERKIYLKDSILMLKHVGYFNVLKCACINCFENSSLKKKVGEIIIEEEHKKEEKNEKIFVDLCKCYISLSYNIPPELRSICVLCLLKAALNKEESEEVQKEVEMTLLALSNITMWKNIPEELFLSEIKEIIKYHQDHHNLTRLAFQSAWQFLTSRLLFIKKLETVILNELHFVGEARRELEESIRHIDWKGKGEEKEKNRIERKEEILLVRWLRMLGRFFVKCKLWNEESTELFSSIVQVFGVAKGNYSEICEECIRSFIAAVKNRVVILDSLLKIGAIDAAFEEIPKSTIKVQMIYYCLKFFIEISRRIKEEKERKDLKRKVFDKLEEEGYEDIIIGLCYCMYKWEFGYLHLIKNCPDYFVYL